MLRPFSLELFNAGNSIPARIAMMAITTSKWIGETGFFEKINL